MTWINQGDSPPANILYVDTVFSDTTFINADINDVNFYIEGAFGVRVLAPLYAEISFGMDNRGTVEVYEGNLHDLGNLIIYPILLQLKYYPLAGINSKIQPFVGGGGGVYYKKRSIQLTNVYTLNYYNTDSETEFNYTLSGGFDWLLGEKFSIEIQGKYMPINFSNDLLTVEDYSATSLTVGIKYRYNSSN